MFALVDAGDFELVSKFSWRACKVGNNWYAVFTPKPVLLHRLVLGMGDRTQDKESVDHINHDGLDNRKKNLRKCTHQQNMFSTRHKLGPSGFRGVHPNGKGWRARVSFNGIEKHIGTFADPKTAALAYDKKATDLYGPFAITNASMGLI